MIVHYKTANGRMTFQVEGAGPKDLFQKIGQLQEVFEAADKCGACESANIRFRMRSVDNNNYYELRCLDCWAALDFGQSKDQVNIFPKRRDKEGHEIGKGGWYHYQGTGRGRD